jgi:hypothetical protein
MNKIDRCFHQSGQALRDRSKRNGRASRSQNAAGVKNTAETDNAGELAPRENRPLKISQAAAPKENTQPAAVSADALNRLIEALTKAIGPVAPQMVREQIAVLCESRHAFPESRIRALELDRTRNYRRGVIKVSLLYAGRTP